MYLIDVIDTLGSGYLSGHGYGRLDEKTGLPRDLDRLVTIINAGVQDVHRRVPAKLRTVVIDVSDAGGSYRIPVSLDEQYKEHTPCLHIVSVTAPNGKPCVINKRAYQSVDNYLFADVPVRMSAVNVLEFPAGYAGAYTVEYHAGAVKVISPKRGNELPLAMIEVDLDGLYMEALCLYVASRVFAAVVTPENGNNLGISFNRMYEQEINRLLNAGSYAQDHMVNEHGFNTRGFV